VRKFWEFTLVCLALGIVFGWLLSLVSGDLFVVIFIGSLGAVVGIILGIIHRNDP
jgi:membrane associated rhomboid family serine protease